MNSIMSISSVFVLAFCLIMTGSFALILINTEMNLDQLDELNKIIFFIDSDYDNEEDLERIKREIDSLPYVASWTFKSKEEALEEFIERYRWDGFDILENDNPLDAEIEIEYKDINDIKTLIYHLERIEGCRDRTVKSDAEVAEFIKNLKNIIMIVLIGFMIILFVFAILIILNTVRLSVHARKQEI